MVRTQVLLTEEQRAFLEGLSRKTGCSMSDLIRDAIEQMRISSMTRIERAQTLLGAFEADQNDVSERHDDCFPL